jgi:hypothetical protein
MAENAQTTTEAVDTTTDYRALYEEAIKRAETAEAERDTQKRQKDNYAKENAEYRRQEQERRQAEIDALPEVERLGKELEASRAATQAAEARIAQMELERSGLDNGFTSEEVKKLIEGKFDFKILAEIVKARTEQAVKSANVAATAATTPETPVGKGSTSTPSAFEAYQRAKSNAPTTVELK